MDALLSRVSFHKATYKVNIVIIFECFESYSAINRLLNMIEFVRGRSKL